MPRAMPPRRERLIYSTMPRLERAEDGVAAKARRDYRRSRGGKIKPREAAALFAVHLRLCRPDQASLCAVCAVILTSPSREPEHAVRRDHSASSVA
jgi:hypothetical protein